ncbi:energy-coupling factor ABC transporter permease [Sulfurimonas sp. SAG-AH-194-I05]|nr:energy-coupling factor ABC transporter permease [Sulfurimonas sp. SAG-AH-194-I05]MDF1875315.1 energy-coupling factor ABC transporter permease [Sulfurimonas sp. SAG-AH-194-I05]
MHIEAGVVAGAKMLLSYGTAVGVLGVSAKLAYDNIKENNIISFMAKSLLATLIVFICFEVFPHYPIGISEVHLILGTTIFLVFGLAPAVVGLALGLAIQGLFFAQFDLPQYGINVTTLVASMLMLSFAMKKIVPEKTAYKEISYTQMLKMSLVWEGAIVSWVAFWALYGQGFEVENLASIASFGSAYMGVVLLEPLVDMAVLALVKTYNKTNECSMLFDARLCKA